MSGVNRLKISEVTKKGLKGKALEEALAKELNSQTCPDNYEKKKK